MTTSNPSTPDSVQELLNLQEEVPEKVVTPETLLEDYLEMSYDEQDDFIYHLLQGQLKFHQFLLQKSQDGDPKLPDTERLEKDVQRLQICVDLYSMVQ